jgi:integrase
MASLIKRENSPFWFACFSAADGRRLKKSTKETDRKRALEVALALERAEGMARRGTLTATRVRQLLGEVLERVSGDELPAHTAESWLRGFVENKSVSTAESTLAGYRNAIDGFLASLGRRAKLNIAAIAPADITRFRDEQLASGKVASTVRTMLAKLIAPLNAAKRQGIIAHNPAEGVDLPTLPKSKSGGDSLSEPFSPEQVAALMEAAIAKRNGKPAFKAGAEWRGAIMLAYFTGARLTDVTNLRWDAINLPGRLLTYREKKGKRYSKEATIPLHPALESLLLEMSAPDSGAAFIFPALAGRTSNVVGETFARIMAEAGIKRELIHDPEPGSKGRKRYNLGFHSLRHTMNSEMANAGVAQEIRQLFTGQKSAKMNERYTHRKLAPLRRAIEKIPSPGKAAE